MRTPQHFRQLVFGGLEADAAAPVVPPAGEEVRILAAAGARQLLEPLLERGLLACGQLGEVDAGDLRVHLVRIAQVDVLTAISAARRLEAGHFLGSARGEKLLHLVLKDRNRRRALVLGVDATVAANEESRRQADKAAVKVTQLVVA